MEKFNLRKIQIWKYANREYANLEKGYKKKTGKRESVKVDIRQNDVWGNWEN